MGEESQLLAGGGAGQRRNVSATISRAIATMVLAALVLSGAGLYWAAHESDAVSVERQARSAQHAIELSIDELALQQEAVAIWDDAAAHIVTPRRDMAWIHDNIGSWLHRMFGQHEVFILDGSDRPIYASVRGRPVGADRYRALAPDLDYLVDSVRGRKPGRNGRHDRNPNRALEPGSTVRTTARAVHDSHLMLVGGRPAAASAMIVRSSTPNYVRPDGEWPVLISVRYIDRAFLAELGTRQLIASPRVSLRAETGSEDHMIPLRTEWGEMIGYFAWRPEMPGTRILWKLVPLNLLVLTALAAFIILIGRRLRKAVGEVAAAEAQAAHLAFHDSMTGLPNRARFREALEALTTGHGIARRFALVLLDVDDFKLTNDALGHDAGDALLLTFADRLRSAVRRDDLVARLGGDEFALLLVGVSRADELEDIAGKLLERLRQPCSHAGKLIDCQASIGASIHDGRCSADDMLKHADLALYEAKSSGRGIFRLYDPNMWSNMLLRRKMISVAKDALEKDLVRPFYQPKVDLLSGEIVGFEALLRCCPEGHPPYGPERLSAAFEDPALAAQLSDRMIQQAISDMVQWRARGLSFGHVAINAAAAELRSGNFADSLIEKLQRAAVPPECVQVEVTESVLLGRGVDHVERTFAQLAEHGIRLALDDFGTGFASLSHLKQFPVEIIKIDRSFVRDLQVDAGDGAIVDALIGLARALRIEVVAEGIETTAQRDFLLALGCGIGQGFLFGKAVPAEDVPALLRKGRQQRSAA